MLLLPNPSLQFIVVRVEMGEKVKYLRNECTVILAVTVMQGKIPLPPPCPDPPPGPAVGGGKEWPIVAGSQLI